MFEKERGEKTPLLSDQIALDNLKPSSSSSFFYEKSDSERITSETSITDENYVQALNSYKNIADVKKWQPNFKVKYWQLTLILLLKILKIYYKGLKTFRKHT